MMGPFKCPECGIWWAGLEHRCALLPPAMDANGWVIRPYSPPIGQGSSTAAPWCGICQGWHVPGMGDCTRTYSA